MSSSPLPSETPDPLPPVRVAHPHVVVDPSVLAGSPHISGTRVPVRRLWAWHRGGAAVETLMRRYPQLGPARVLCALAFAYDNEALVEADLAREQGLLERGGVKPEGLRPMAQQPLPLASLPVRPSAKNAEPKRLLRQDSGGSRSGGSLPVRKPLDIPARKRDTRPDNCGLSDELRLNDPPPHALADKVRRS